MQFIKSTVCNTTNVKQTQLHVIQVRYWYYKYLSCNKELNSLYQKCIHFSYASSASMVSLNKRPVCHIAHLSNTIYNIISFIESDTQKLDSVVEYMLVLRIFKLFSRYSYVKHLEDLVRRWLISISHWFFKKERNNRPTMVAPSKPKYHDLNKLLKINSM